MQTRQREHEQTVYYNILFSETVQDMFRTPLYQQHASHTLASRAHGPQPHNHAELISHRTTYTRMTFDELRDIWCHLMKTDGWRTRECRRGGGLWVLVWGCRVEKYILVRSEKTAVENPKPAPALPETRVSRQVL